VKRFVICALLLACSATVVTSRPQESPSPPADPTTTLWYRQPAEKWQDALPLGNGRLGAMAFGRTDEEPIQINEDTYWSGGPYSTTVAGAHAALPAIREAIFAGDLIRGHKLFNRHLLGRPVEQQKYQALGHIVLTFPTGGAVSAYRHELDLTTAVEKTTWTRAGVGFTREIFVSPIDQVIVVRISADRPGSVSLRVQLRGERNAAHSNYATDYFRMDGDGVDGLRLRGRSADYMGVAGRVRYEAALRARADAGTVRVDGDTLHIDRADRVTLLTAAATSFVSWKDVSADPAVRVDATLAKALASPYERVRAAHVAEHARLFRRVSITLDANADSQWPTDERLRRFDGRNDPALAGLLFQFGRYLLISSSRPGTQPANLQGIWNREMNPPWDAKYTTNINTQMNYWPAEVANLSETAGPLFQMIGELAEQGAGVAREHYGARGWVAHQNTDIWRVAAPMDGASWGAFTPGGAWLTTHLWEHYQFTRDEAFLRAHYPLMRGAAEFFLDFLVPHPTHGWLVTNPSTSPENFPIAPGNDPFFDEVTTFMSTGTSLAAGSAIDTQIVSDLFDQVAAASRVLGVDDALRARVLAARARLPPIQVGANGELQEWLEDWGQREKSHRHISHLYAVYPGRQISPRTTPALATASRRVLQQRGLVGTGWSSAWKAAAWARLGDAPQALANIVYAVGNYTTASLFSICSRNLQVDGALGMTAAIAELLVQSQDEEIVLLPALPDAWPNGAVRGLRARGGFEVDLQWSSGRLTRAEVVSNAGGVCRVRSAAAGTASAGGRQVTLRRLAPDLVEFDTVRGARYVLAP
jgi:alpha-L-fucosidase 2